MVTQIEQTSEELRDCASQLRYASESMISSIHIMDGTIKCVASSVSLAEERLAKIEELLPAVELLSHLAAEMSEELLWYITPIPDGPARDEHFRNE